MVAFLSYRGTMDKRLKPTVYGVGYIGIGEHKPTLNGKHTKPYIAWKGMLRRCYSVEYLLRKPSYISAMVSDEFRNYQTFASWYLEKNINNWELDKDVLSSGDIRIYSKEFCIFLPKDINSCISRNPNIELLKERLKPYINTGLINTELADNILNYISKAN